MFRMRLISRKLNIRLQSLLGFNYLIILVTCIVESRGRTNGEHDFISIPAYINMLRPSSGRDISYVCYIIRNCSISVFSDIITIFIFIILKIFELDNCQNNESLVSYLHFYILMKYMYFSRRNCFLVDEFIFHFNLFFTEISKGKLKNQSGALRLSFC